MQLKNSAENYGAIAKALHWTVAVLVLLAWLLGTFHDNFPKGAARAAELFVHMSVGLTIISLAAVRLAWRFTDPRPLPQNSFFSEWGKRAEKVVQYTLYALLIVVPIVGIVLQFARGRALPVFGLFEIASPWAADRTFAHTVKEVHETLADGLMILAGVHVAAALFHHWIFRDRTLLRMLPGRPRSNSQ